MAKRVKVPGRLESAETGNIVTGADAVMDDERGKTQVVVNNEVEAAILSLAQNKQNVLTFDNAPTEGSQNPVTSAGVYTADKALSDAIEAILLLIPSAASALNKLVDMQTMNSSIATATASFKGTYNLVSDLRLGVDATHEQIGAALDALSLEADNNDYAFVLIPNSATTPTEISKTERYKFNGTNWLFEYDLNNSGFTSEQWNAINSGVTSVLVGKLSDLPTDAELTTLLAGKQDNLTFDNVPTAGSTNPVKSGGVYARNNEIVALINELDAAKQNVLTFDNAPVEGSTNPVKSGGVYTAISAVQAAVVALDAAKQNVLTFDSTPTLGSANPVTSSGIKTELNRIDGNITTLNDLYEALTQSALVIVQPTDTWPVASPATSTIYRVVDRENTPPQYYSDYMWNGSAMVLMATYDNAIDDVPTPGSNNLVKSGGAFRGINDFDKIYNEVAVTAFDYAGGDGFTFDSSIYANRTSSPYYFGLVNKFVVKFRITAPANASDFWVGVVTNENKLVCTNLFVDASSKYNYKNIGQGDTSAHGFVPADKGGTRIYGGTTYDMEMYCIDHLFYVYANGELVRYVNIGESLHICGIGFLNLSLSSGIFSNLKKYNNIFSDKFSYKYIATASSYSNLLSHIIDNGVYNIQTDGNWLDAPARLGDDGGILEVEQGTGNNVLQKYYVIKTSFRAVYYRLVNKSSFSDVIPWAYLDNKVVHNSETIITDAIVTEKGWTHFYDLPKNTVSCLDLSAANYNALGFPKAAPGTLEILCPYTATSPTTVSYNVYLYVTNDGFDNTQMFIAFGHGTTVTKWSQLSTYNSPNSGNPLAQALFNDEKVAFVGDSIIAGLGGTGYDATQSGGGDFIIHTNIDRYENIAGYCWVNEMISHLSSVYNKTNVHNRGVGGINTKAIYDNFATLVDGATTVVLSCGINDYGNNSNVRYYLGMISNYCKSNSIKLMVMTNTPNNTTDAAMYNAVKGRITATCSELGIPVFDMYSEFEMIRKLKGLQLSEVLTSDGIHPNDAGYEIMYDAALKLFGI